jgi:hypothetical protein
MRDIRPDLAERIEHIREEKQELTSRLRVLEAEESNLKSTLEFENRRYHVDQPALLPAQPTDATSRPSATPSLRSFIMNTLKHGIALSLGELLLVAEKQHVQVLPGKSLARSMNATLLGLQSAGVAERGPEKKWHLLKLETPQAEASGVFQ